MKKILVHPLPTGFGQKAKENPLELKQDRENYLTKIYTSNLPLSATDHYDIRTVTTPIRRGDFLNIIINKIHLAVNGEALPGIMDTGEIAVVVTVSDGSEEPKQVLVAYETDIGKDIDLPIKDLVAYSTESYGDEPIRIEVVVLDLDQKENKTSAQVLSSAATIGAAMMPAYAPAISIANQVGKILIDTNKDDVIVKMTLQLYPWKPGDPGRVSDQVGIPRVGIGQYLILNSKKHKDIDFVEEIVHFRDKLHASWDLSLYKVPLTPQQLIKLSNKVHSKVNDRTAVKSWPIPFSEEKEFPSEPIHDMNYLVVTVDKTPVSSAAQIIAQVDTINRAASGMAKNGRLTQVTSSALAESLDDVKSLVKRIARVGEFHKSKSDPKSLQILFSLYKDPNQPLKEMDKSAVYELANSLIPCIPREFFNEHRKKFPRAQSNSMETLETWYKTIKGRLFYDTETGRYRLGQEDLTDNIPRLYQQCALNP